MPSENVIKKTY